eukprot:m.26926 g.26926  ORF g.26926 m.26926 type:complete len:132 (+) comp4345_c0_seq2:376-771(+)
MSSASCAAVWVTVHRVHSLPDTPFTSDPEPTWLPWDAVVQRAEELGLQTVPVLFHGPVDSLGSLQALIEAAARRPSAVGTTLPEGFVVRTTGAIPAARFDRCMAKYVRRDHIQTTPDFVRTWRQARVHAPE